jgi:hypothetical protein
MGVRLGGRQPGTPNKINADIKKALSKLIKTEINGLPELLQQLTPWQRTDAILKIIKLILPAPLPETPEGTGNAETIAKFINALRNSEPAKPEPVKPKKKKTEQQSEPTKQEAPTQKEPTSTIEVFPFAPEK